MIRVYATDFSYTSPAARKNTNSSVKCSQTSRKPFSVHGNVLTRVKHERIKGRGNSIIIFNLKNNILKRKKVQA